MEKVTNDRSSDEGTLSGSEKPQAPHASKLAALERPAPGQYGVTGKRNALDDELFPVDSFVQQSDGSHVFWADLTGKQRRGFVWRQYADLFSRDTAVVGAQFRNDPLSPLTNYYQKYALPGMGLFTEGFVICAWRETAGAADPSSLDRQPQVALWRRLAAVLGRRADCLQHSLRRGH